MHNDDGISMCTFSHVKNGVWNIKKPLLIMHISWLFWAKIKKLMINFSIVHDLPQFLRSMINDILWKLTNEI